MKSIFSQKSLDKMKGVDERLVKVMQATIADSPYDFGITEGLRTVERQRQLVDQGLSLTMNSKHIVGKAVDIVIYINGKPNWEFSKYKEVADKVMEKAKELGISVRWGGTFKKLKDGPHFELM